MVRQARVNWRGVCGCGARRLAHAQLSQRRSAYVAAVISGRDRRRRSGRTHIATLTDSP